MFRCLGVGAKFRNETINLFVFFSYGAYGAETNDSRVLK